MCGEGILVSSKVSCNHRKKTHGPGGPMGWSLCTLCLLGCWGIAWCSVAASLQPLLVHYQDSLPYWSMVVVQTMQLLSYFPICR